jgi:predicted GNAT family N-acyltransferase
VKLTRLTHFDDKHLSQLHQLYQGEWWCRGRSLADITRAIAGTDYIFAFTDESSDQLVAFTRVLSDGVYKAFLFDVIVHPNYRGNGFGRLLMDAILADPDLSRVQHIELYCLPEMTDYYRQFGFTTELGQICLMRRATAVRLS